MRNYTSHSILVASGTLYIEITLVCRCQENVLTHALYFGRTDKLLMDYLPRAWGQWKTNPLIRSLADIWVRVKISFWWNPQNPHSLLTSNHSFLFFPHLWNKPPQSLQSLSSLQGFKQLFHHSPIHTHDLFYLCFRRPNPALSKFPVFPSRVFALRQELFN